MARFQLLGDWPFTGQHLAPASTFIDADDPQYNGTPLPFPFPLNSKALDQTGLDLLAYWYGEDYYYLFHYDRALKLPAIGYPPANPLKELSQEGGPD